MHVRSSVLIRGTAQLDVIPGLRRRSHRRDFLAGPVGRSHPARLWLSKYPNPGQDSLARRSLPWWRPGRGRPAVRRVS